MGGILPFWNGKFKSPALGDVEGEEWQMLCWDGLHRMDLAVA